MADCACTPGTVENGWHEKRSPECHAKELAAFARALDLAGIRHRTTEPPPRPPWVDPRGCFGHCDPEGWFVPCAKPTNPGDA